MYVAAIVAAGGTGRRFGGAVPKQLLALDGMTILARSVRALVRHPRIDEVVVALPQEFVAEPLALAAGTTKPVRVVAGGERRQDSVARAFAEVSRAADVILVHDAARPLVEPDLIHRTIDAAARWGAAIAAVRAHDTIKLTAAPDEEGPVVAETIDRARVWLAQTPQVFTRRVFEAALAEGRAGAAGTDEARLAELAGHAVHLVEGSPRNLKITTPEDLAQAERWLSGRRGEAAGDGRQTMDVRIGVGYDSHRLVAGRAFVLGGVTVPHPTGPVGHSDGDALCHAITDAVLGGAALGDIGRHFPDTDPRWKDADSIAMLRHAVTLVHAAGFRVGNVDAVVIAERPKLSPHVDAIRTRLAETLGIEPHFVSVKGKTNEGMGELGRGEGIAVHAVATVYPLSVSDTSPRTR